MNHTVRHVETIRLISARKANAGERKQYREVRISAIVDACFILIVDGVSG